MPQRHPRHRGRHSHGAWDAARSEEHTSELQSRSDLVCRLLLEKKKQHENVVNEAVFGAAVTSCYPGRLLTASEVKDRSRIDHRMALEVLASLDRIVLPHRVSDT